MKKVALSLIALLAVGSFAYAQDAAKLTNTITASAEVKWAYDVETGANGFTNSNDFVLVVPFANAGTVTKGGEGTYGEITVEDVQLDVQNDNGTTSIESDYSVSAKIVSGPFTIGIDEPGYGWNNAAMMGPLSIDEWEDESIMADSASIGGGISVGYTSDMFSVTAYLSSNGNESATAASAGTPASTSYVNTVSDVLILEADAITAGHINPTTGVAWAVADGNISIGEFYIKKVVTAAVAGTGAVAANEKSEYTVGIEASVTPVKDVVTATFAAVKDLYTTGNLGLSAGLTLTPVTMLKITAGFDALKEGDLDLTWDAAAAATLTLENADALSLMTFYSPADSFQATDAYLEAGVSFTEDAAKGFVENLGASAYFKGYKLLNTAMTGFSGMPAFVGASVDYLVTIEEGKTVKPYAAFDYGLYTQDADDTWNGIAFKAGVEAAVIANTTITVEYAAGGIGDDVEGSSNYNLVDNSATTGNKGTFSITASVAY